MPLPKETRPEQHACGRRAREQLRLAEGYGCWVWKLRATDLIVEYCPWCGLKLPRWRAFVPRIV